MADARPASSKRQRSAIQKFDPSVASEWDAARMPVRRPLAEPKPRTATGPVAPWDAVLKRLRLRLNRLGFALHQLETHTAPSKRARLTQSSNDGAEDLVVVRHSVRAAKESIVEDRRALAELLREMLQCGASLVPNADPDDGSNCVCSACGSGDDSKDNPILLCDHAGCARGFHRLCLYVPPEVDQLQDDDAPWVCEYCEALSEALSIIVEVDPDVDRDSISELIVALEAAADATAAAMNDDDAPPATSAEDAAIASAENAAVEILPSGPSGHATRRRQINFSVLHALMFDDASGTSDDDYPGAPLRSDDQSASADEEEGEDDDEQEEEEGGSARGVRAAAASAAEAIRAELIADPGDSDAADSSFESETSDSDAPESASDE
jgi:hypothetical protein